MKLRLGLICITIEVRLVRRVAPEEGPVPHEQGRVMMREAVRRVEESIPVGDEELSRAKVLVSTTDDDEGTKTYRELFLKPRRVGGNRLRGASFTSFLVAMGLLVVLPFLAIKAIRHFTGHRAPAEVDERDYSNAGLR